MTDAAISQIARHLGSLAATMRELTAIQKVFNENFVKFASLYKERNVTHELSVDQQELPFNVDAMVDLMETARILEARTTGRNQEITQELAESLENKEDDMKHRDNDSAATQDEQTAGDIHELVGDINTLQGETGRRTTIDKDKD
jgi:hypothetical protein